MEKINARQKGARFERDLAKTFQTWWGRPVSRTPLSGGWGSNQFHDTMGDLVCAGGWPLCVEAKNQEGWHLEQLLRNEKCDIYAWWQQACDAARLGKNKKRKMPLLVFTRNQQPEYLMIVKSDLQQLSPDWEILDGVMEFYMRNTSDVCLIMLLADFIRNVKPPKPSPNHDRVVRRSLIKGRKRKKIKLHRDEQS